MSYKTAFLLTASLAVAGASDPRVLLVGAPGASYEPLAAALSRKGISAGQGPQGNHTAVVLLPGADWSRVHSEELEGLPVLAIAGDLDGVSRFSSFAAARHRAHRAASSSRRKKTFAVIEGASHASFAPELVVGSSVLRKVDLRPEIDHATARDRAATLIHQWADSSVGAGAELAAAETRAAQLAAPLIKALQLEGSPNIGKDVCNSDFPTNPTCNYPKYPDFALPPGPAPPPSPLPAKDCICGSNWVTDYAFPELAGASDKGFSVNVADAFHDVSDVHPFHLPHNWNTCAKPEGCTLNVTTLTMNFAGDSPLFPNTTSPPLSALELRTKMKSRKIIWEAAGLGKQSADVDKKNLTLCKRANQAAWDWALDNADADVKARFEKSGEPFVMVDDVEAPIGLSGPEWIKKELVYTRNEESKSVEVQSWMFVVGESPIKSKYLPTGMHYCKLLSPARCMEWIYTDGLRRGLAVDKEVE
jgi:hypothetical protein